MTNSTTFGSGVAPDGSGGVTLAAGTYEVSYSWQGDANGGNEEVSAFLELSGTEVAGSRIKSTTVGSVAVEGEISNTMTIVVPPGGGDLQLFNGANAMLHSSLTGITGSINVKQVAP
jgi:hypothetical protein